MNLEEELRRALSREAPPRGFAERVIRRARVQRIYSWAAVAAAVAILALVPSAIQEHQRRREIQGRKAGHDLAIALRITSKKLQTAQKLIRRRADGA